MNKKSSLITATSAILLSLIGLAATGPTLSALASPPKVTVKDQLSCSKPAKGFAACLAIRRTLSVNGVRGKIHPLASIQPLGGIAYGANQIRKAYGVTELGSRYKVIAVVDAYHSASAFQDLSDYRAMYNLGSMDDCSDQTTGNGLRVAAIPVGKNPCFIQLDQNSVPAGDHATEDEGWAQETALDIEMASAICPHCSILLAEAKTSSLANFDRAVSVAGSFKGVRSISNSYGGFDTAETKYLSYASAAAKGIAVVASTGDSGFGVSAPASFASVIAVGGTSLHVDGRGKWQSETAWFKSGSGCSLYNRAATWQPISQTGCAGKLTADVSAVADPATGVAVAFEGGWYTFGGTSVAAPIIAGMYAVGPEVGDSAGEFTFANADKLHDVVDGSNGRCDVKYWCTAREGWDGPTGMGSPNGSDAF